MARLLIFAALIAVIVALFLAQRASTTRRYSEFVRIAQVCSRLEQGDYVSLSELVRELRQQLEHFVATHRPSQDAVRRMVDPNQPGQATAGRWLIVLVEGRDLGAALLAWAREQEQAKRDQALQEIDPTQEHALPILVDHRLVDVRGTGVHHGSVLVEIENLTDHSLRLTIHPGTLLHALDGCTDVVLRESSALALEPGASLSQPMKATCVDPDRPLPGPTYHFRGVSPPNPAVAEFMEASAERHPMVAQVGLWALLHGFTGAEAQARLQRIGADGREQSLIKDAHAAEAEQLLATLS